MIAQKDAFELHGQTQSHFLNSDAIYLTTYAALVFWFINEVLHSDCIVYSSDRWLTAVYENLSKLKLEFKSLEGTNIPLINVIEDYTGHGAQIMSDVRRIQQLVTKHSKHSLAACRACRWLLLTTWDKLLTAPSKLLSVRNKQYRIVRPKAAEAFDQAIYTLLAFARLCTTLGLFYSLKDRNQQIIERLVAASCPLDELRNFAIQEKLDSSAERLNKWPIRKSDAIAMQTILDIAIDCRIHVSKCWNDVIR
ncbi:unnamed protein product [Onchocerca flexuosa]|uniref:RNase H domain-containing protein n=1 Tax=Onchocerca flexuosa TaxID=387005 RepID=A0A183HEW4_9BILA|nr:unnamed protein product [Onchocerca flexuosa]